MTCKGKQVLHVGGKVRSPSDDMAVLLVGYEDQCLWSEDRILRSFGASQKRMLSILMTTLKMNLRITLEATGSHCNLGFRESLDILRTQKNKTLAMLDPLRI
jgi:hypothetical protein